MRIKLKLTANRKRPLSQTWAVYPDGRRYLVSRYDSVGGGYCYGQYLYATPKSYAMERAVEEGARLVKTRKNEVPPR